MVGKNFRFDDRKIYRSHLFRFSYFYRSKQNIIHKHKNIFKKNLY